MKPAPSVRRSGGEEEQPGSPRGWRTTEREKESINCPVRTISLLHSLHGCVRACVCPGRGHDSLPCCPAACKAMRVRMRQSAGALHQTQRWRAPPPRDYWGGPLAAIIPAAPHTDTSLALWAGRGVPAVRHPRRGRMTAVRRARSPWAAWSVPTAHGKGRSWETPSSLGRPMRATRPSKSPVGRSPRSSGWARRAATRGWSPAHLRLAALRVSSGRIPSLGPWLCP